ncbi:MAG: formylglycine-generating enzyme family protein [bacterium]|nr:formylglycine-generating enzyme family protein [bacterium]
MCGLVPIGENPSTGLWEFYHLRSAWDGSADPAELPIPTHRPDGSIEVSPDHGLVFVLLPAGTAQVGSQKRSKDRVGYDPMSKMQEWPLQTVELGPFFVSRYETTQRQWARLAEGRESDRRPSHFNEGLIIWSKWLIGPTNPVESVSWEDCNRLARQHGLLLPTEARWEYACRANTTTPWSFDFEEREHYAHLATKDRPPFHEPIGQRRPNAFGLHDMHGNIAEWCADYAAYVEPIEPDDGLRPGSGLRHAIRGGSYECEVVDTRSSARHPYEPTFRDAATGVRFARALRP